jgi:type II secretory pathway component PulF
MPTFYYKAKNKEAITVSGQITAANQTEAVEHISQMGYLPVSVEEAGSRPGGKGIISQMRVSPQTLYLFNRQLYHLLKAGVPILRALEIMGQQQRQLRFREVIESVRLSVQQGRALSESLRDYPKIFPELYVSMIRAGEEGGSLREVLKDLGEYQRGQLEIMNRVKTAAAYPLVMFLFGIGTVFFILTYVLPQITKLFDNLQQALPLPTLVVIRISAWLTDWRILLGLGLLILFGAFWTQGFLRSTAGRLWIGRLSLKMPGLGIFLLKIDLARFARTLELLLKGGVSIVQAIKLAIPVVGNEVLRRDLLQCHDELLAGRSLSDSLKNIEAVPELFGYLISVGEESGALNQTLRDVSETYEQEIQEGILLPIFQMDIFSS